MATIKVRVQGEIATNLTPEVKLVCQNDKYDVEFEFDESWSNSNFKTALFVYNGQLIAIPFDGNVCKIPKLFDTQLLHIGVKSDDYVGLHTSTPAKVGCLLSASDITSDKIPEPTQDVYDEIIALLNKYISGGGEGVDLRDYQKKVDEGLETESKTIVGAINEVKGLAETARMVFGETEGTAYEGNKGKENAKNIANLKNELAIVNVALEQSGLVKKYKQPIEQEYNERVTADGANVLDGSRAILKKVVGNTVRYDMDENGLNGKLASASFTGIESVNIDGTGNSTIAFPKTPTPLGTTIDFETKKITNYGVEIVLTGTENWGHVKYANGGKTYNSLMVYNGLSWAETRANGVTTDGVVVTTGAYGYGYWWIGVNSRSLMWLGILDSLGFTSGWTDISNPTDEEKATAIASFKAYIAQRYSDGNPVTIRYVSSTLQSETDFTADNEYTVWKGGTEKVRDNDGAEYGADNTLTQNYILVAEVK